jgi:hypothetical protein
MAFRPAAPILCKTYSQPWKPPASNSSARPTTDPGFAFRRPPANHRRAEPSLAIAEPGRSPSEAGSRAGACPAKVGSHPLLRKEEMAMSGNKQRFFTDESKREAVRLIATSVQQVANDLGISKLTLSRWRSEHERGEG